MLSMIVGHECRGQPFRQASVGVSRQFPGGSWYVIRPSCLVQPLYSSVAIAVPNSWPLRCVTSEKVEKESVWSGPEDDGWRYCVTCVLQLAQGVTVVPREIKFHMNNQCVCFRFEMILISVELSRCLSSAWVVFVYLGCLCIITGFIFMVMFIFTLECLQPFFKFLLGVSVHEYVCVCVGTCATEQRQFWRGILEIDGLPKVF